MRRGREKGWTRRRAVGRAEQLLLRRAWPRAQMTLILMATGCAGFVVSFALLHAGLTRMWLRYPVAILSAYAVFLLLLRLWLAAQSRRKSFPDLDADLAGVDLPGADLSGVVGRGGATPDFGFGGAGDFAGGGAGGTVDGATEAASSLSSGGGSTAGGGGGSGGGLLDSINLSLDFDDEGCAVVLAVAAVALAVLAGLVVSFYVVWAAPALLAEILVDGLLVAGLYKRVKQAERRHWLRAAVRRTILPVVLTAASFTAAGYAMQRAVPQARSVGEFWKAVFDD
ncbi:MAG TPA: hypothetical protein VIP46_14165 [Pyrinomonadaceae bacterium]